MTSYEYQVIAFVADSRRTTHFEHGVSVRQSDGAVGYALDRMTGTLNKFGAESWRVILIEPDKVGGYTVFLMREIP